MTGGDLFHYTCDHGHAAIERDGFLLPNAHPFLPDRLVWATDLERPFADVLGLTSFSLKCDRTAHRHVIDPADVGAFEPWTRYARRLPAGLRDALESAPGTMPRHWWVARRPVRVLVGVSA